MYTIHVEIRLITKGSTLQWWNLASYNSKLAPFHT